MLHLLFWLFSATISSKYLVAIHGTVTILVSVHWTLIPVVVFFTLAFVFVFYSWMFKPARFGVNRNIIGGHIPQWLWLEWIP